jgi:TrkA domain protein
MAEIRETPLPGVGLRYDFATDGGERLGVIAHRSGRRELLVYDREDPDRCRETLTLDEEDAWTLAELLGGPKLTGPLATLQQSIQGLTIDWFRVEPGHASAGATIGDLQLRRRTGTTVVAIQRGERTVPSPTPEQRFDVDDVAVLVGTPEGIERAIGVLREG